METKLIGFICLVFVLILVTVSLHGAQETGAEVRLPDLRTRKSGSDWGRFLGPTGDGKSPETSLLTSWSPAWVHPSFGTRRSGPVTVRQPFPKDDCSCSIATMDRLA